MNCEADRREIYKKTDLVKMPPVQQRMQHSVMGNGLANHIKLRKKNNHSALTSVTK